MVAVWAEPGHHYTSAELLLQLFLLRLDSRIAVWVRFSYVDSGHDTLLYHLIIIGNDLYQCIGVLKIVLGQ